MKKWMIVLAVVFGVSFTSFAGIGEKVLLWVPNRVLDLTDIVSLGLGFGGVKAEARVTRAVDFSIGDGFYLMARKDYRRQTGLSLEQGHHLNFFYVGVEDYNIDDVVRFKVWNFPLEGVYSNGSLTCNNYSYDWWPSPAAEEYHYNKGTRDWWEIAAEAACVVSARVAVHPVEIADFVCGIFFIDFMNDDIQLDVSAEPAE